MIVDLWCTIYEYWNV